MRIRNRAFEMSIFPCDACVTALDAATGQILKYEKEWDD